MLCRSRQRQFLQCADGLLLADLGSIRGHPITVSGGVASVEGHPITMSGGSIMDSGSITGVTSAPGSVVDQPISRELEGHPITMSGGSIMSSAQGPIQGHPVTVSGGSIMDSAAYGSAQGHPITLSGGSIMDSGFASAAGGPASVVDSGGSTTEAADLHGILSDSATSAPQATRGMGAGMFAGTLTGSSPTSSPQVRLLVALTKCCVHAGHRSAPNNEPAQSLTQVQSGSSAGLEPIQETAPPSEAGGVQSEGETQPSGYYGSPFPGVRLLFQATPAPRFPGLWLMRDSHACRRRS